MENQIENWTENCEDLAKWIYADDNATEQTMWVTNCLLKKYKRGTIPIYAQLVYSSIVKKIVREVAKEYEYRLTTKERKAMHIYVADYILKCFEDETKVNVERVAV